MSDKQLQFWDEFIQFHHLSKETKCYDFCVFGIHKETIDELTDLVLSGKKTATTSAVDAYEDADHFPKVGDYSLVLDFDKNPVAIIKTISIEVIPFNQVTWDFAKLEGEDLNLESWQNNHRKFFKEEAIELAYEFKEDMLVLIETFERVFKK